MNILHVLSGDFVSGAETSTAALIEAQMHDGHQAFIASGQFTHPTEAKIFTVPIYKRGIGSRLSNILRLMRIIRAEKIEIVHAHSRAASWVSYWACRLTGTAYLSTLHGRQHLHFSNENFNIYGPTCAVVCENIREQMLNETKVFQPEQLVIVRNGFDL
ncbi:MAG TPA: glycosyltransferase [bacterium]|nr:glycosyltransferase [bacterium]